VPAETRDERPDRRQELLDAAWDVIDALPLHKVFAGATAAAVSDAAGVTTGSFFHHFANSTEFAEAMVRSVATPPGDQDPTTDEFIDVLDHMEVTDAIRSASRHVWEMFTADERLAATNRHLLLLQAFQNTPLPEPDGGTTTVGQLLFRSQRAGELSGVAMSEEVLRRSRRTPVEPFTVERMVLALTALFNGLAQRHALDPGAVDDELFADVASVLVATLTQPVGSRRHVEDVAALDGLGLSPQARVGALRRDATRRRIVERAAGLFADGWDDVTASDVADRSGVSTQTVLNAFGSVRSVAAATFGRHLQTVALPEDGRSGVEALRSVLVQLAAAASADAGAARALLDERLDDRHRRPLERSGVDEFVPLAELVEPLVAAVLEGDGDEGPSADELTGAVVDLVLRQGVALPGDPDGAADLALRLVAVGPPGGPTSDSSRRPTRR
jgi:AcrR family transcriptional regulator